MRAPPVRKLLGSWLLASCSKDAAVFFSLLTVLPAAASRCGSVLAFMLASAANAHTSSRSAGFHNRAANSDAVKHELGHRAFQSGRPFFRSCSRLGRDSEHGFEQPESVSLLNADATHHWSRRLSAQQRFPRNSCLSPKNRRVFRAPFGFE